MDALEPADDRPTVLALRALKLGDLLVAVPALHALRRAFPEYRLVYAAPGWLADALGLVGGFQLLPTPGLDFPLAVGPGAVDVAVNLHGCGSESELRIRDTGAPRFVSHRTSSSDGPRWTDGLHERERWTRLLQWHGIEADPLDYTLDPPPRPSPCPGSTVVHVGAAYGSRLWPEERFAAVASSLRESGHRVVFTGGAADRERALRVSRIGGFPEQAVLAGSLPLAAFAAVIAEARLVVSADTGAAHLATAYGRPSVVLFGPAPPEEWGPPPGPHTPLTVARLRRGDIFSKDPDPALLGVGTHDVLEAVRGLGLL
jgi:ADP-heptose:LPS heptosyltransferase